MNRRGFLTGLAFAAAAPAIIRTPGLLMRIRPERIPRRHYTVEGIITVPTDPAAFAMGARWAALQQQYEQHMTRAAEAMAEAYDHETLFGRPPRFNEAAEQLLAGVTAKLEMQTLSEDVMTGIATTGLRPGQLVRLRRVAA